MITVENVSRTDIGDEDGVLLGEGLEKGAITTTVAVDMFVSEGNLHKLVIWNFFLLFT